MTETASSISVHRDGDVTVVRMSLAENRFNPRTIAAVNEALDAVEATEGPGAVVLTGDGKFFSNGLDLDWMSEHPNEADDLLRSVHRLFGRLLGFPTPTVAAINGHAFAAGAMLALACDSRVMREDRGFLCLPEVDLGLPFTDGMTALLKARLSPTAARDAMLTGRRYSAAEALAAGLIDSCVPADDVLPTAVARMAALATKPRATLAAIKLGLYAEALGILGRDS